LSEPLLVARLTEERRQFHADLLASKVLHIKQKTGFANVADGGNPTSVALGGGVLHALKAETWGEAVAPQTGGQRFEKAVEDFVIRAFGMLAPFGGRGFTTSRRNKITAYHQYRPVDPARLSDERIDALRQAFGGDYMVKPDILVERRALSLEELNGAGRVVDDKVGTMAAIRTARSPILHASISCKQTIRSDRSQNSRLEALNLLRMRTGRAPHIVVVTAEPLPTRIASVAVGTGDFDCTYHIALPELRAAMDAHLAAAPNRRAINDRGHQRSELLRMIDNGRLKDIADLPLDLLL
jgi:NgoMIV restriction enzyme